MASQISEQIRIEVQVLELCDITAQMGFYREGLCSECMGGLENGLRRTRIQPKTGAGIVGCFLWEVR